MTVNYQPGPYEPGPQGNDTAVPEGCGTIVLDGLAFATIIGTIALFIYWMV